MDSNFEDERDRNIDFDSEYEMIPMPIMPAFMPGSVMGMGMMENAMDPEMMRDYGFQDMGMFQMMPPQAAGCNFPDYDGDEDDDEFNEPARQKKPYKDKSGYQNEKNKNKPGYQQQGYQNEVNKIFRKIRRYNPGIFRRLNMYGVPYYAANRIVRRIIRLTLMYSEY